MLALAGDLFFALLQRSSGRSQFVKRHEYTHLAPELRHQGMGRRWSRYHLLGLVVLVLVLVRVLPVHPGVPERCASERDKLQLLTDLPQPQLCSAPQLSALGTPCSGSCGDCACRWQRHRNLYTETSGGCAHRWQIPCSLCSGSCGGYVGTTPSHRNLYTASSRDRACTFRVFSLMNPSRQISDWRAPWISCRTSFLLRKRISITPHAWDPHTCRLGK